MLPELMKWRIPLIVMRFKILSVGVKMLSPRYVN
uniref:Uncharacterized protein n=1 Tax=Ralstonia solanacearum TaxID=305 RepID=A0A0S4TTG6_RALSL|nr:protein of unknown function [Ralstonia solanacearum]